MTQQLSLSLVSRKPLNSDRIVSLNLGLGRDSIAKVCLLVEGKLEVEGHGRITPEEVDYVVFSDTGCEWEHTYDLIPVSRDNPVHSVAIARAP